MQNDIHRVYHNHRMVKDKEWVHDSIICEIAHLTELGYKVEYTNTDYTNGGNDI